MAPRAGAPCKASGDRGQQLVSKLSKRRKHLAWSRQQGGREITHSVDASASPALENAIQGVCESVRNQPIEWLAGLCFDGDSEGRAARNGTYCQVRISHFADAFIKSDVCLGLTALERRGACARV